MIQDIIAILRNDVELSNLLGATATDSKISPNYAVKDGIKYEFNILTNDKIKVQANLVLTIVNNDLLVAYAIKSKLDEILLTLGDEQLTDDILQVSQTGGGSYYDSDLDIQKINVTYTLVYKNRR